MSTDNVTQPRGLRSPASGDDTEKENILYLDDTSTVGLINNSRSNIDHLIDIIHWLRGLAS